MTLRHLSAEQLFGHSPFPATKKELVRAAQRNGASDTFVTALLDAEQVRFDSEADLRRALAQSGARRAGR
jgi:hypothetical protein